MTCSSPHARPRPHRYLGRTARYLFCIGVAVAAVMAAGVSSALGAVGSLPPVVSSPADLHHPSRPARPPDRGSVSKKLLVVDPAVSNTVPGFAESDLIGGTEPSIAVNPTNPAEVAMTSFSGSWASGDAPLWFSADAGRTWTQEFTIPAPPGLPATCPCDQTLDYSRTGSLFGAFLTINVSGGFDVVTGDSTDPTTTGGWEWRGNPVQLTDSAHPGNADQPWLIVAPDPARLATDAAHVGYDDFNAGPRAQVATSRGAEPPDFSIDTSPGLESPLATNPGLRLAADAQDGTLYALFERSQVSTSTFPFQPRTVSYVLNRSTDGGLTWGLNGSPDGIVVDTVKSDQAPFYKFGTVNALLGGVDHLAVDPRSGDVYVVYGSDTAQTGVGNQLLIRTLHPDHAGGLTIGPAEVVSEASSAALPSVAVTDNGTVGVLYDTFDGFSTDGFPLFTAHLARTHNDGKTFTDTVLEQFTSPETDNADIRQRVMGDYQQLKALGSTFYGVFSGNRAPFGGSRSIIDPIFFSASGNASSSGP